MRKFSGTLSLIILLICISCFKTYPAAPTISYRNMSNNFIREVKINWNGINLPGSYKVAPDAGGSSNFDVVQKSDFYGPVHLSWKNAKGKIITRDFIFTEKHLPNFGVKEKRARIKIYFTQEDVLIFISKNGNLYMNDDQAALGKAFLGRYSKYHTKMCPDYLKLNAPECKLPIQDDPEWEKISEYYIKKYGVEAYNK